MESAVQSTYPGSGDKTIQISPDNWETITDAMAATVGPGGTAGAVRLEGIDFAGKTGTAQVVNHSAGATSLSAGKERANAWFVGMAPRRNPDIVVAVLCEHGGWGAEAAAPLAARVINAFVEKQRKRSGNIRVVEAKPAVAPALPSAPPPPVTPGSAPATISAMRPSDPDKRTATVN
jgi:penicillin-binding protein 2